MGLIHHHTKRNNLARRILHPEHAAIRPLPGRQLLHLHRTTNQQQLTRHRHTHKNMRHKQPMATTDNRHNLPHRRHILHHHHILHQRRRKRNPRRRRCTRTIRRLRSIAGPTIHLDRPDKLQLCQRRRHNIPNTLNRRNNPANSHRQSNYVHLRQHSRRSIQRHQHPARNIRHLRRNRTQRTAKQRTLQHNNERRWI